MSKVDLVVAQKAAILAGEDAALQSGLEVMYDGAFSEGVASVPPADADEQAKIDAAVAAAVGPLNVQLAALQAKDDADVASLAAGQAALVDLQSKMDALAAKEAVEAGTLAALQSAKDALAKVLADLSGIGAAPAV